MMIKKKIGVLERRTWNMPEDNLIVVHWFEAVVALKAAYIPLRNFQWDYMWEMQHDNM